MRKILSFLCKTFLSPRNYYRLARFLWLDARGDPKNTIGGNGEVEVQAAALKRAKTMGSLYCFDIGANLGLYAEGLLTTAKDCDSISKLKLFCFEPNPICADKIKSRLLSFGEGESFEVVPKVVTNVAGTMDFYITGDTSGSSSLVVDTKKVTAKKIAVECVTFDEFCELKGINEVLLAKVDTEGNDMRVLEGAKNMLSAGKIHYLQFEYNYRWIFFRNYLKDVFDLVQPLGYEIAKVTSDGLEVYPQWHNELEVYREGNYIIGKNLEALGLRLKKTPIF